MTILKLKRIITLKSNRLLCLVHWEQSLPVDFARDPHKIDTLKTLKGAEETMKIDSEIKKLSKQQQ